MRILAAHLKTGDVLLDGREIVGLVHGVDSITAELGTTDPATGHLLVRTDVYRAAATVEIQPRGDVLLG